MKLEGLGKDSVKHYKYQCALTRELDSAMGIADKPSKFFRHYIEVDTISLEDRVLGIRVPGCTVGGIKLDKHTDRIVDVYLGVSSVMDYPESVKDSLKKYIGEVIEYV